MSDGVPRFNCSVDTAMSVIEGRWKCTIICLLATNGEMRFSELMKTIGEVTSGILTRQLKELESDGMVRRRVDASGKVKVFYSLTDRGRSVLPVIHALAEWGRAQMIQVIVLV